MAHAVQAEIGNPAETSEGNVAWGVFCAIGFALGALALGASAGHEHAEHPAVAVPSADSPREVSGAKGGIATAHPLASKAGLEVLRKGGNAFDALVAASFVISVVEPQSTGLGGGGFVVYHDAVSKQNGAIDGREVAPLRATRDMYVGSNGKAVPGYRRGPLSAGVPGLVAMLYQVYETRGSGLVSWYDLVKPAAEIAEVGVEVTPHLARVIRRERANLERYPHSRKVFMPGGKPLEVGDRLVQNDLAHTLLAIAEEGADGFYRGAVAKEIAQASVDFGGLLTVADFEGYRVKERTAIEGTYRGVRVVSMPPPSSGGTHLVQMLNTLSHFDMSGSRPSEQHLHLLTEAMRRAFADRAEFMADADFVHVPIAQLTDEAYGAALARDIDPRNATPSREVRPGDLFTKESDHTTHISIIDEHGNAVASTQTINTGLGSCFVAGRTGVLLNNEMNDFTGVPGGANEFGLAQSDKNLPEPGKRPLSSMSPTILIGADGKVMAAVGSPGGPRIITTVLQTVSNLVDHEMSALEAIAQPRIHHQWVTNGEDTLFVEQGVQSTLGLSARGHHVVRRGYGYSGNAQVVVVKPDGTRVAASDPRQHGRPGAYSWSLADEAHGHTHEGDGHDHDHDGDGRDHADDHVDEEMPEKE